MILGRHVRRSPWNMFWFITGMSGFCLRFSCPPNTPLSLSSFASRTQIPRMCGLLYLLQNITSSVALRVFGEAADHRLHRLLQHGRVPRVAVAAGPWPQSHSSVQVVELQRRRGRWRPGRSGQRGRGGKQRRDRDRDSGSERGGAEGPRRYRSEANPRLQPLRADTVRDHVGFHCPHVTSTKVRFGEEDGVDETPQRALKRWDLERSRTRSAGVYPVSPEIRS